MEWAERFSDWLTQSAKDKAVFGTLNDWLTEHRRAAAQTGERIAGRVPEGAQRLWSAARSRGLVDEKEVIAGVFAGLSQVVRWVSEEGCDVSANHVLSCQVEDVTLQRKSAVTGNRCMISQLSAVEVTQSNLVGNQIELSRLRGVVLRESRMEESSFLLSQLLALTLNESDFIGNQVARSSVEDTKLDGSRFSKGGFKGTRLLGCLFQGCDIQGLVLEDCSLQDCTWTGVEIAASGEPGVLRGIRAKGVQVRGVTSLEDLRAQLLQTTQETPPV